MTKKKHYLDIVIMKEKLSTGAPVFVVHCISLGITSQGSTIEEAHRNIKEAIDLYLEECPEKIDEVASESPPTFSYVEV
ncbi:MAG TPA: type II toxin-antitoxin system HicB family antitoxin [Candidatus Nanoarchaeia archaeon]|nr:type II toxin-antitoxin system HicB family antitoxin [Candidatus Nanoarchaeia archaeon]